MGFDLAASSREQRELGTHEEGVAQQQCEREEHRAGVTHGRA